MKQIARGIIFTLLCAYFQVNITAQVFFSQGGKINDFDTFEKVDSFPISVAGLSNYINDSFGLSKVCINLTHDRVSDLRIELLAPDGTKLWLSNRNGGTEGRNYLATCFKNGGFSGYVREGSAPFIGDYIPDGRLEFVNNGQNPNGIWYLLIADLKPEYIGDINEILLHFEENPNPNKDKSPCDFNNAKDCFSTAKNGDLLPDLVLVEEITRNNITVFDANHAEYPAQIRFAAAIANIGEGPIETFGKNEWYCGNERVKDGEVICKDGSNPRQTLYQRVYQKKPNSDTLSYVDVAAGTNYFDEKPGHSHYHVDDWVSFRILDGKYKKGKFKTKKIIASGSKVSYCLFDSGICNNQDSLCLISGISYGRANLKNYGLGNYKACNADIQGISVGGYDTYGYLYEGQFLQLPKNLKTGTYFLEVNIDPKNIYREVNEKNNVYLFQFSIK
ncbi:MAG TPA: lysyl oxidase family protein [Saprospiraceae bacterium]|nr:lysyl oxidase family protein [Saprospiraceae bacterium]